MINIIVPIVDRNKKFDNILNKLSQMTDLNVLVGINEDIFLDVRSKIEDSENITFFKYAKGSKREAVINALQSKIVTGSILVMRKPLTLDEFNQFIYSNHDIVTCKRKFNKFSSFIFNVWQKILKMILGLKLYDGDTSAIFMGDDISAVVSASGNLSFSSRVNRWRGVEQSTVQTTAENVKSEFDKKDNIKFAITSIFSLLIAIVVTTCVAVFTQIGIIVGLLLVCLDMICLSITFIMLLLLLFNISVGKKNFVNAMELNEHFIIEENENFENKETYDTDEEVE